MQKEIIYVFTRKNENLTKCTGYDVKISLTARSTRFKYGAFLAVLGEPNSDFNLKSIGQLHSVR